MKSNCELNSLHNLEVLSVSESSNCDIDDCIPPNIDCSQHLKLLNQNIRSISKNITELHTLLTRTKLTWDFIILTECWLPVNNMVPVIEGYNLFKTTVNNTQNEGVVTYVRKDLHVIVEEPVFKDANCLQIKIDHRTILLSVYRPPGYKDLTNFLDSLDKVLANISHYQNIIVAGDININISEQCQDVNKNNYLNLLASHGILPAHILPTRLNACLDHIALKTVLPALTRVAHSALTDHDTVLLFLAKKMPRQP